MLKIKICDYVSWADLVKTKDKAFWKKYDEETSLYGDFERLYLNECYFYRIIVVNRKDKTYLPHPEYYGMAEGDICKVIGNLSEVNMCLLRGTLKDRPGCSVLYGTEKGTEFIKEYLAQGHWVKEDEFDPDEHPEKRTVSFLKFDEIRKALEYCNAKPGESYYTWDWDDDNFIEIDII